MQPSTFHIKPKESTMDVSRQSGPLDRIRTVPDDNKGHSNQLISPKEVNKNRIHVRKLSSESKDGAACGVSTQINFPNPLHWPTEEIVTL